MQVYGRRNSINVQKVLWCLAELGFEEGREFSRIDAGLEYGVIDTPEYRARNPNGLVPTLVDGESGLWESNTIVRYLAAKYGAQTLLPSEPAARADVERWMDWQLGTLWATLRVTFLGLTRVPEAQRDYDAIERSYREATRLLGIADAILEKHDYLAQDRFTVADIGVGLAAHRWVQLAERFPDTLGAPQALPSVDRWLRAIKARPAFSVAVAS
ncbi:glutathione S-transferase family protein [Paraburkholderia phytofirmans]|uniref:Glutathione S-transferase domain n=1 Tax=Paraburkholderia phytofirmans (strain DSM 17436 / LMG 22146 / PsJN) TaxID=398527 RepID=B2T4V7_PARPJ|nr:glutathione S-transferase family protein [Paraburkholderia phytofirmans]ACD16618.1 Glutathione S-transferase domain [Paraburkholderia phytofirmans PsJN]